MNYTARLIAIAIATGSLVQKGSAADEHVMLMNNEYGEKRVVLELKEGDVASLAYYMANAYFGPTLFGGASGISGSIWSGGGSWFRVEHHGTKVEVIPDSKGTLVIPGPAVITLAGSGVATFKVARAGTATPPAEVPQEAGSNFDVILEQSSDFVNWTPANPGSYSGTETKRFFRTRIVKKQ
jgi:hypothetical protein